jgi:hypothetical protein
MLKRPVDMENTDGLPKSMQPSPMDLPVDGDPGSFTTLDRFRNNAVIAPSMVLSSCKRRGLCGSGLGIRR